MTLRIYWVPHTRCPFGCLHCHNDSLPNGSGSEEAVISALVAQLPDDGSPYRPTDVLIGGGEGLAERTNVVHLVRALRSRYPQGTAPTLDARRAGGSLIIAIQTAGPPLADGAGALVREKVSRWLDLGVDYFQVASGDMFHRSRNSRYPWDALEGSMRAYEAETGVVFQIYGKEINRLVPSGRVLDNLDALEALGAQLLTEEGYCANGWETGSRFLSGLHSPFPECAEVVIDPQGWVHPCCWYLLSPGLFDLRTTDFESGMRALRSDPFCLATDRGDIVGAAQLAGLDITRSCAIRDATGDCGLCRLASLLLSRQEDYRWLLSQPLSPAERVFYSEHGGADVVALLSDQEGGRRNG